MDVVAFSSISITAQDCRNTNSGVDFTRAFFCWLVPAGLLHYYFHYGMHQMACINSRVHWQIIITTCSYQTGCMDIIDHWGPRNECFCPRRPWNICPRPVSSHIPAAYGLVTGNRRGLLLIGVTFLLDCRDLSFLWEPQCFHG